MMAKAELPTFNSLREALSLPVPKDRFVEYPHQSVRGFKVRVHPADAQGRVKRQWALRAKFTVNGVADEDRSTYGLLEARDKTEVAVGYQEAMRRVLERLAEIERLKNAPQEAERASKRLTVADAWARHAVETRTQRETTTDKEVALYQQYYGRYADLYLDELTYKDFWSHFVTGLGQGKLLNADLLTWEKLGSKRAEATIIGIVNLGAKLYAFAHAAEGLPGKPVGWNPAKEAKKLIGTPNKRSGHIPLKRIAEVWRAADVLCSSWARDQLRVYLLTGLRHSLLVGLNFSEIDAKARVLKLSPHKPGTKRRGAKTPANAPDLVVPVCQAALDTMLARRDWAPDPKGPVWYSTTQPGGKAAAKGRAEVTVNSDPRSNWSRIEELVLEGQHFTRHDLRRTFAQIAVAAGADLMGTSLLMLHSPRTVARVLNLPEVTLDYINTQEARAQMRSASNSIERFVKGLLDGSVTLAEDEGEPELPELLREAVGNESDDD